jgi:hypothetical protein
MNRIHALSHVTFLALALAGAGCAPMQRSLRDASVAAIPAGERAAHLGAVEVIDARPPDELRELTPDVRYVVPLIVWNQWATEGHLRPEARLYSPDTARELSLVVTDAFAKSGIASSDGAGPAFRLEIKLRHLYGITHASQIAIATIGAASTAVRTFAPYGYAAAEVTVLDGQGHVIGSRSVVGAFDPNLSDLSGGGQLSAKNVTDELTAAAVQASGSLATNIVRAVEPMLGRYPARKPFDPQAVSTFFICRPVREGAFLEVASVRIDTGEILEDVVVPRWMEPYAAVDEWVVDPYLRGGAGRGGVRLTQEEYEQLVARLQERYDVRYVSDVRTAHFFGAKRGLASPKESSPGAGP